MAMTAGLGLHLQSFTGNGETANKSIHSINFLRNIFYQPWSIDLKTAIECREQKLMQKPKCFDI